MVSQYYFPESQRLPDSLAVELKGLGHEVSVITGYPNYPTGTLFPGYEIKASFSEDINGVTVHRVPIFVSHNSNPFARFINYFSFALSTLRLTRLARSSDITYVYCAQMTAAIPPRLWKFFFKTPYLLHIEDLWPESITESNMAGPIWMRKAIYFLLSPWLKSMYRNADGLIAISDGMKDALINRGCKPSSVERIYNWFPETSSAELGRAGRAGMKKRARPVKILYAGNFGQHQSLETVLLAAERVGNLVQIDLVGSGTNENFLKNLATKLKLNNVTFTNRVSFEEMQKFHDEADFELITLSDSKFLEITIPSKFQASLFHGNPVITAVNGELKSLVRDNNLGFSAAAMSVDGLAEAMTQASACDAEKVKVLRNACNVFYETFMSQREAAKRFASVMERIVREKPGTNFD